ncbi:MAG: apolipoprotein N-acyltransferase, partial [Desulfobacteraceae bacterium 4572_19]
YSQVKLTTLIQIADITGIYGLSFIVILANIVVFTIILWLTNKQWQGKNISKKDCMIFLLILLLIITGVYFYGKQRIQSIDKQINNAVKTKIAVIQGNIDQTHKWDTSFQVSLIEKYIRLSQEAKNADLIVWPETAIPFYYSHDEALTKLVNDGIKKCNAWFILGSPSFKRDKENIKYFNSAFLVDPNENVHGRYDKYHLVPFGEYVPFRKYFPFLGKIVAQVGDFSSGLEGHALKWENNKLGIQTCFEIIFPNLSRAIVKNGAGIIINITNDAWFGYSSAPYQHFSMAVFRAIENRRVLVRAANTGISGFIDPVGRVISITKLFKEAVVTNTVPMLYKLSLYTRFGDFFTIACIIITLTVILFNSDLWDKLKVHLKTKK